MEALCWAAPLGRMAFTNYLLQSLIFGWIFYGYGLGLFGSGLPPLQRWESGFMPFKSCSAGGGSGAFASVRWNAVAHPHVRDSPADAHRSDIRIKIRRSRPDFCPRASRHSCRSPRAFDSATAY
jgi:hypothetical protein